MAEWKITPCGHGGYTVDYGEQHSGGVLAPTGIGVTMPAFIVYRSVHFDTEKQAKKYVKEQRERERKKSRQYFRKTIYDGVFRVGEVLRDFAGKAFVIVGLTTNYYEVEEVDA